MRSQGAAVVLAHSHRREREGGGDLDVGSERSSCDSQEGALLAVVAVQRLGARADPSISHTSSWTT